MFAIYNFWIHVNLSTIRSSWYPRLRFLCYEIFYFSKTPLYIFHYFVVHFIFHFLFGVYSPPIPICCKSLNRLWSDCSSYISGECWIPLYRCFCWCGVFVVIHCCFHSCLTNLSSLLLSNIVVTRLEGVSSLFLVFPVVLTIDCQVLKVRRDCVFFQNIVSACVEVVSASTVAESFKNPPKIEHSSVVVICACVRLSLCCLA